MKKFIVLTDLEWIPRITVEADEAKITGNGGLNFFVESNKEGVGLILKASFVPDHLVGFSRTDLNDIENYESIPIPQRHSN